MDTFVADTQSPSQYKDILIFLAEQPLLQSFYIEGLTSRLIAQNDLNSALAEQVSLHLCQRNVSPVQQFFNTYQSSTHRLSGEVKNENSDGASQNADLIRWPIWFNIQSSIGQTYKKIVCVGGQKLELRANFTTLPSLKISMCH